MATTALEALASARSEGLTIATAESLTGGLVAAALTAVPGASDVFVGGVVTYSLGAKEDVLRIPAATLEKYGPVSEETALAMARGARELLRADVAVATTGAAGPEPHGGRAAGTFCVAVVGPLASRSLTAMVSGTREVVREEAVNRAIKALCEVLDSAAGEGTSVE